MNTWQVPFMPSIVWQSTHPDPDPEPKPELDPEPELNPDPELEPELEPDPEEGFNCDSSHVESG